MRLWAVTSTSFALYAKKRVGGQMYEILVLAPSRPIRLARCGFLRAHDRHKLMLAISTNIFVQMGHRTGEGN